MAAERDQIGHYHLLRVLGRGGMGVVYEAVDMRIGRSVALKVLAEKHATDTAIRRFEREARSAARVVHPNVVMLLDVILEGDTHALVHELVPGGSVHDRIVKEGRIPWRDAARLGAGIAAGLGAVHAAGLVHRDVKPGNVLIDARGQPRITDFGVARNSVGDSSLSKTGVLVGTLDYLAPELAETSAVGPAADLYALGATLHKMLTGSPPFAGAGPMLITQHMRATPPSVQKEAPDVPDDFAALVLRLLSKAPGARGASADAVAAELDAIAKGVKEATEVAPHRRVGLAVAAIALAAVAGAGVFALLSARAAGVLELGVDRPTEGQRVEGERVRVTGRARGATTVSCNDAQATPGPTGEFSLDVALVTSELLVVATGPRGSVEARRQVRPAAPDWYLALAPAARPRLPLRRGLELGPNPREYTNRKDGSRLVYVPAGRFKMGAPLDAAVLFGDLAGKNGFRIAGKSAPIHWVTLSAYFIGEFEVSVSQYRAYVEDSHAKTEERRTTGVTPNGEIWSNDAPVLVTWARPDGPNDDEAPGDEPVVCVTWTEAQAYCAWAGLSLTSEAQWEKAAIWDPEMVASRPFPWGWERPSPERPRANYRDKCLLDRYPEAFSGMWPHRDGFARRAPVGAMKEDVSYYLARDMAGNCQELVADCEVEPFDVTATTDPVAITRTPTKVVMRGGSWMDYPEWTPAAQRNTTPIEQVRHDRTFRVAILERAP